MLYIALFMFSFVSMTIFQIIVLYYCHKQLEINLELLSLKYSLKSVLVTESQIMKNFLC